MKKLTLCCAMVFVGACATTEEKKPAPAPPPVAAQCPKIDVQRINEISDIDKENQHEINKVNELEQRLANLQQKLSGALAPTNDKKEQANVAAVGNLVRVRMSEELLFRSGSARISEGGRKALDQVADVLKNSPSHRIEIAGHTDSLPMSIKKYEDNWELSVTRARRVGTYLIEKGVDPKRVVMSGYADSQPVDPADTEEARAKNRRVEILIEPSAG